MLEPTYSKREQIVRLHVGGLSYAEIGRQFGLSRQRVRQIAVGETKTKRRPDRSDLDSFLTISQVADLLNVHVNTVRRWDSRGMLTTYRIGPRGDRRFKRSDVNSILKKMS